MGTHCGEMLYLFTMYFYFSAFFWLWWALMLRVFVWCFFGEEWGLGVGRVQEGLERSNLGGKDWLLLEYCYFSVFIQHKSKREGLHPSIGFLCIWWAIGPHMIMCIWRDFYNSNNPYLYIKGPQGGRFPRFRLRTWRCWSLVPWIGTS